MTATSAGLSIRTYTHEHMKLGNGPQNLCSPPYASWKYAYSAPDRGTTVPSSANANAPVGINNIQLQPHFLSVSFREFYL